ncbi:MAG: ABC transporter ATP-binding protein [Bacilli bacterium]|nr:ABC transporter ATP-binding protein [Bacilli bacterium]
MKHLIHILKYAKKYKKWLLYGTLFVLFEIVMDLFLPIITANIINVGILNNNTYYIILNIILMIFLSLIGILGGVLSTYYTSKATGYMVSDIRKELFKKINQLSILQIDKLKINHVITLISNDIPLIGSIVVLIIRILIKIPIILFGSILMTFFISFKLAIILLLFLPIMILIIYILMKKAFPYFEYTEQAIDDVNGIVREDINCIKVIKTFCNEKKEINRFDLHNKNSKKLNIEAIKILSLVMPIMMFIINLIIVLILWFGHFEIKNSNIEVGDIVAFIQYLNNILSSLMAGSAILIMASRSDVSAKRVNNILNMPINEIKCGNLKNEIKGNIKFCNVDFEYEKGSGDYVLKNLNFEINAKEKVAITGPTGAGKSTLISLLLRFYEVNNGQVLVDNQDIKNYDLKILRQQISVCLQKNYLFKGTINDNLKLDSISNKELINACEICNIYDFIQDKKNQFDYEISQKGINLSGGQKQRLSLARTIIKKSNIYIFDEVMSSIDLKNEKEIMNKILSQYQNKTIIFASSRINLFKNFDKIILLNNGIIEAIGTHEQLLNNKLYKTLYETQVNDNE